MSEEIKEVHIKSYDEWLKYYENATKEQVIEDLTQDVKYFADAVKDIKYLQKEIERLNNIINELEKWLEEQHQFIIEIPAYTKEISIEHKTMEICYENVLDKLQELKESNEPTFEEMVNFVENVCKDIKSQSTLDEELEEERERIAKIVGDFKEVISNE